MAPRAGYVPITDDEIQAVKAVAENFRQRGQEQVSVSVIAMNLSLGVKYGYRKRPPIPGMTPDRAGRLMKRAGFRQHRNGQRLYDLAG